MPQPAQSRFGRRFRIHFRRFRITVLLGILALLGAAIYLNRVGLPDLLKRPLLDKLRARGVELEFSRLRLRFYRGIVAENVRFGRAEEPASPRLSAKEAGVKLNYRALTKLHLQVDALGLRSGRFELPVADTNQPPRTLVIENIRADLRFLPDDRWTLDGLHATFAGATFALSGTVTNASLIRNWDFLHAKRPSRTSAERLRQLADTLEKIHFTAPPELRLSVNGDARDLQSFAVNLTLHAPSADTPWGRIADGLLSVRHFPSTRNEPSHAEVKFEAADAETPWASAGGLNLAIQLVSMAGQTNLANCDLILSAARAETRWVKATNLQFTAHWVHSLTNAVPLSGRGELLGAAVSSRWASGSGVQITASLAAAADAPPADVSWGGWRNLQPYDLDWACRVTELHAEKFLADQIRCTGRWHAPALTVTNLHADFHDGALDARAQLDVTTREARFDLVSDFDVREIAPLLTARARNWLAKFSWATPPRLAGGGSVILPAWVPPWRDQPDWRSQVQPTLRLAAEFAITNGAYLGVAADWAHAHVIYSNLIWRLPDLEVGRPEGRLNLAHETDDRTKDYYWRVHGTIDPRALRPLLSTNVQRGLDHFTFTALPLVDGEMWGRFFEYDRIGFAGHVALTNFTFRGQTADSFESALRYTNRILEFFEPHFLRDTQVVNAAAVTVDINAQRVYVTNGFSTAEPLVVAKAIGPKTGRALEPYRFTQPPTVRVNGFAPFWSDADADMRFDVDGGPFEWWKFKVPHISGEVHWLGQALTLTNVVTAFYGGDAGGSADFAFRREPGTDFAFTAAVTNANLQSLIADLSTHTNHLEGRLTGRLTLTNANSTDNRSWNGYGRMQLQDGLIWEIPIFGVLSKPLDAVMPGLGSSRAGDGSARFIITNGVIQSDTLEFRAPLMRLQYAGTLDLTGHVDARVTADLLRDAWGVGPLLSLAFKPVGKFFEYKVTGTLREPKAEPLYFIPKFVIGLLHPFHILEEVFSGDSSKTNAPPFPKTEP